MRDMANIELEQKKKSMLFAMLGFTLSLIAFYPGFMSPDSLNQYTQSKTLIFNDWHPPVMAWVWSIFNVFSDGPQGMLMFHLAMLWGALYLFYDYYKEYTYAWLIFAIGYLPWIINFSGVLWKDVGMAFSLLLWMALTLTKRHPRYIVFSSWFLFYAFAVRGNSIFAIAPLLIWFFAYLFPQLTKTRIVLFSSLLLATLISLSAVFNHTIVNASNVHAENYMMLDDLFFLSLHEKKSLIPDVSFEDIQACESVSIFYTPLIGRHFCLQSIQSIKTDPLKADLKSIWIKQVSTHVVPYLKYRFAAFRYFLRSPWYPPYYFWQDGVLPNEMGIKQKINGLSLLNEKYVFATAKTLPFLFKPYWWLSLGIGLLIFVTLAKKNNSTRLDQALLISSITYIITYIPLTPSADFRYIYWSVLATSLTGVGVILRWVPRSIVLP